MNETTRTAFQARSRSEGQSLRTKTAQSSGVAAKERGLGRRQSVVSADSSAKKVDAGRGANEQALDVLLIDDSKQFITTIGRGFEELGGSVWIARTFDEASYAVRVSGASYVVSEMRIAGRNMVDFIEQVRDVVPVDHFVVATAYPSVAAAVKMTKLGVAGYLAKPTSAADIVDALGAAIARNEPSELPCRWPSLDLTIWEYLNQVYEQSGSMSEAARRLQLDRRSLRRMLAKYPPRR